MSDYNGFTGRERLRTFGLQKWLVKMGALTPLLHCQICDQPCDQEHAEDYFNLERWIELCRGCHGKLHKRFSNPLVWQRHLDEREVPASSWAHALSARPFDLASYIKSRGAGEPSYATFVER